ncbi:MAG: DUF6268 family outer membrane beta-barrel protein [Syntrophales bacterium]|nr:DUF6268 family outer membrane beta-barrel protein [Syntrophales bacterium]MDD5641369.1 DUF6268 family outer membrane beta-barrel protein [Syntrophales bacterium]
MKIFSLQSSQTRQPRPVCGNHNCTANRKISSAGSIFLFLSLLLSISACGGGGVGGLRIEGPSRLPREVQPGSPVSAAAVNQFPSGVSGGGSLRVISVYTEGGYAYNVNEKLQIGISANYGYDNFYFTGLNFYAPRPWSNVHYVGVSPSVLYHLQDKWCLMVVPVLQGAGEPGADIGRALIYGGAVAGVYNFGKDRVIGLGIGALNNVDRASLFPFIMVNWRFNKHWRLATPYRAGPAGPGGLELSYSPIEKLEFGLGVTYLSKRFRLSPANLIDNGIGEYDTVPLIARMSFRILPVVDLNLYGGASLYNYIRLENSRAKKLFHSHQNVAPFVGVGLSLNFEKFTGG